MAQGSAAHVLVGLVHSWEAAVWLLQEVAVATPTVASGSQAPVAVSAQLWQGKQVQTIRAVQKSSSWDAESQEQRWERGNYLCTWRKRP